MKNRRRFLAALSVTGASLVLAGRSGAAAASPAPKATPAPSATALATAAAMRRFDARLSDAEIATIARGIDDNAKAATKLHAPKNRLRNGDEPVTTFVVRSQ